MHGYNMIETHINYTRYIFMVEPSVHWYNVASVTGANYCPDYYLWYIYIYMIEDSYSMLVLKVSLAFFE